MKALLIGIAGLFGVSGCGSEVIVADGSGGDLGAGGPAFSNAGAVVTPSGGSGGATFIPAEECSVSPDSYVTYSTQEELNELLVGRWRRCTAPQIAGEDVGVEFTDDGKIYPLTLDDAQQTIRRTGVDYVKTWAYGEPGDEDPISHQPSKDGFIVLDGVITSPPDFTAEPRQLRILLSPAFSRYVPLEP